MHSTIIVAYILSCDTNQFLKSRCPPCFKKETLKLILRNIDFDLEKPIRLENLAKIFDSPLIIPI